MTAKMQQSIRMLQMSAQELREAVEKEFLENPALELEEADEEPEEKSLQGDPEPESGLPAYGGEAPGAEFPVPTGVSLEEELMEQANFVFPGEGERAIAAFLIGSIDDRGYLGVSVPEIAKTVGCGEEEVLRILRRIQDFEPPGVGARDLRECLRIQAKQRGIYDGLVATLIDGYLGDVAASRIKRIAEREGERPEDVQTAVDILRTLNPKPGNAYGVDGSHYLVPDVLVTQRDGVYRVAINEKEAPRLRLSPLYRNVEGFDEDTKAYIQHSIHSATWLLQCIEQRKRTLCRVVEEIVHRQRPCVEQGLSHLLPMTMKQVAESIGMHESTVSRAVANKFVGLPWGIVSLRKFFTGSLGKPESQETLTAGQAKAALGELIREENPQNPLSDQKLAELLSARGMEISRRTVMKYREQLGYPSSVKRKRY